MSVSSVYVREIAQGDGVNTVFGFPWKFVAAFDLMVYIDDVLQPASAYEVKNPITKDRGEIVFRTAPAVGAVVVIRRMDNQQQTRLFKNQENFNAHEVEKAFDKLTLLIQEGFEELRRGALRMQSQSNLDYTIESLTIDDGMLALDLANKIYKQTSFTQAQVQKVIDNAVRSVDLSVKNMAWDGNSLVLSLADNASKKGVVSGNVAQIRVQHDDDNNWWLEWSLDGQIWKSSDVYTKTEIDTALSAKADTAALTAEITRATNAESELSGRITTNAEEIGTIKTDLDDLGDQVHGIEEKIPAKASAINQLATMADIQQSGGLSEVVHDDTMAGTGRADSPLSVKTDDFVKKSAAEMQALSGPLTVKDEICLTDPDDNAVKHSLAIVAGIPTETAADMDIIGNRKFDTLPTSDDTTAYADLNPKSMITKGQTASAIDALDAKIDIAGTSGKIIGSYWFGKTKASTAVPAPTLVGQNYYDFTTGQVYKSTDGATWTLDGTNTPPTDIDAQIIVSSKFWDITEQENQHGGKAWWSHTNSEWSYSPTIYEDKPVGASLPLLTRLVSDHKFNDVSYLNANAFSWQPGSVYEAVYQYLVDSLSTAGALQTETIEGITISYKVATDGQRICMPDQETAISQLYAKTGEANFYILDTINAQFKLPRTQKRRLIRAVKNDDGTWYNLYSDGWVEQGGKNSASATKEFKTIPLIIAMESNIYGIQTSVASAWEGTKDSFNLTILNYTTTSFDARGVYQNPEVTDYFGIRFRWMVEGYAADSVLANEPVQYEYYYVGNFERSAIEQTAGLNAELFNNKADLNLMNTAANVDFVVESQLPTAANGYNWYRKYKSGWVEQGGTNTQTYADFRTVVLPIAMRANFLPTIQVTMFTDSTDGGSLSTQYGDYTGKQFKAGVRWNGAWSDAWFSWTACGYAE